VRGWIGIELVDVEIIATTDAQWFMNGIPQPSLSGCVDVDLNFSPSTNLLPVRRLNLGIGESAAVRAAWLRFPSLKLEVLEQSYRRSAADIYEYESDHGRFKASLQLNEAGFALDYAGIWRSEALA
jgi:hypothetical protein